MTTWPSSSAGSSSPPDFAVHALSRSPCKKPGPSSPPGPPPARDQQKPRNTRGEELVEPGCGACGHALHGGVGDRGTEQVRQRLDGALLGQELSDIEVEDDCGDPRPVLHR